MSAPAQRLQPIRNPVLPDPTNQDTRYWRSFKSPLVIKETNAVNHVHFSPSSPHDLAMTSSTRIQILSCKTHQVLKTFSRFKDTVYSGEFRYDGKLLVAGDATGLIQAFDTNSRSVLVTLKPTSHAVHVTKFHPSSATTLLSASDDRVVRLWDLTSPEPLLEFRNHEDYVRTACFVDNLVATGCYDGYVRLFDPRAGHQHIARFAQRDPVESVLNLNGSTLVSAGGTTIKFWDLGVGRQVAKMSNFQKTVTSLSLAGDRGILAGSVDGHVKVIDTNKPSYPVVFGWKYGGSVLCTGLSPDMRQLATGLTTGIVSIRTRAREPKAKQQAKEKSSTYARMVRGAEYQGADDHQVVQGQKRTRVRLKAFEKHIRAFHWSDALDSAFSQGVSPQQTLMVLNELRTRGKVGVALANRDDSSLELVLKWAIRAVHDVRSVSLVADYTAAIMDLYALSIERSPVLSRLVRELQLLVDAQVEQAREAWRLEGMLNMLMG